MTDTPARLLTLLSLLQTPREWPGSELALRLDVSGRTIRRDIERLRDLGYPVEASLGAVGGYRLAAGTAMPPLLLDDEEAVAIAVGLRASATHPVEGIEEASVRAMTKLEQVLPSRLRRRVGALHAATAPFPTPEAEVRLDPELLTALASAIANTERVRFGYVTGGGGSAGRHVEPVKLVSHGRRWYLLAFDLDRDDWRVFRADRIDAPRGTGARSAARELPGGDPGAFVRDKLYSVVPVYRAVVTLHLSAEAVRGRFGDTPDDVVPLDGGRCRVRGHTDTLEWTASRLLMFGCEFEVHEPPELIDHLTRLGERAIRAGGGRQKPGVNG